MLRTNQIPDIPGYQPAGKEAFLILHATSSLPRDVEINLQVDIYSAISDTSAGELILASRPDDLLEIWLREIVPTETETLKLKVSNWIESKVAEFFEYMKEQLKKANG